MMMMSSLFTVGKRLGSRRSSSSRRRVAERIATAATSTTTGCPSNLPCGGHRLGRQYRYYRLYHNNNKSTSTSSSSPSSQYFVEPTIILFLSNLLPEPNASAAGVRTKFLVEQLAQTRGVEAIHYGTAKPLKTTATDTTSSVTINSLKELGVEFHYSISPNNSNGIKDFLSKRIGVNEGKNLLVIMDRFYVEEMYSHHIHHHCPTKAAIVLDMQDLHSLRKNRQQIIQQRDQRQQHRNNTSYDPLSNLPVTLQEFPNALDLHLQRELASIHRSDLALVCSPVEMDALQNLYGIPRSKLCCATFFVDDNTTPTPTSFDQRKDFVFVGGFKHDPNKDALQQMKQYLWEPIRERLLELGEEDVKFHVYGPYCPDALRKVCHDPSTGFYVHGKTNLSIAEILEGKRVLLAPLRYGAGIKGKVVDAWTYGIPVVTTPIGSEGMMMMWDKNNNNNNDNQDGGGQQNHNIWGVVVANNTQSFIDGAINLYRDKTQWQNAQQRGYEIISSLYSIRHWQDSPGGGGGGVLEQLIDVCNNLESRRRHDYNRSILWQQSTRSTEYFSKWLELKQEEEKERERETKPKK